MTGPYRAGGSELACPRCNAQMVAGSPVHTCEANGCGEWWTKQALAPSIAWSAIEACEPFRVFGAALVLPCPVCEANMIVSMRAKIEFAHCDAHGLWLDRHMRRALDALGGWSKILRVR